MNVVVWNSLGDKWNPFLSKSNQPKLFDWRTDDVGLLVESGWPTWLPDCDVYLNYVYESSSVKSFPPLTAYSIKDGTLRAFWIPWVKSTQTASGITNSAKSLGVVYRRRSNYFFQGKTIDEFRYFERPVVVTQASTAGQVKLTLFQVHLVSGHPSTAINRVRKIMGWVKSVAPQSTPCLIAGDMNINLNANAALVTAINNDPNWRLLALTDAAGKFVPTHSGGSVLDWALLYDPNTQLAASTATLVKKWQKPPDTSSSDHSCIRYTIPLQ